MFAAGPAGFREVPVRTAAGWKPIAPHSNIPLGRDTSGAPSAGATGRLVREGSRMSSSFPPRPNPLAELLERRRLLSAGIVGNINVGKMLGNQAEGAIVVNRASPSKVFAVSNLDVGDGLMASTSSDGGTTWSRRTIANDKDGLPAACCDPSAEFDSFGNLYLAYLNASTDAVVILRSTDAGQNFTLLKEFHGNIDQPTIAVGPGGVWVEWDTAGGIAVSGAANNGLGDTGEFSKEQVLPGSRQGAFGDIAVGPAGQVMVTYQRPAGATAKIYVQTDPDGVGPAGFGRPILATSTHTVDFDYVSAQPNRGIDAEAALAFDRSGGAFDGRVYLVYTDQTPGTENTDILLRYSDTGGANWSNPVRVNDDTTLTSQILPNVAADDTTGDVAVGWYDARNDTAPGSAGDTDGVPNDDVEYFAALVKPLTYGVTVSPNLQVSTGATNAQSAQSGIDLGDYTAIDFHNGVVHPLWFDNSNSTGDNPDGTLKDLDVYTARVPATTFAAATVASPGGLVDPTGPVAALYFAGGANPGFVRRGASYTITVQYADVDGVSIPSLTDQDLLVTGPDGFSRPAQLVRAKTRKGGVVLATYRVINPTGKFTAAQGGTYQIELEPGQVLDDTGQPSTPGVLGTFAVTTGGAGSHPGAKGPKHRKGGEHEE